MTSLWVFRKGPTSLDNKNNLVDDRIPFDFGFVSILVLEKEGGIVGRSFRTYARVVALKLRCVKLRGAKEYVFFFTKLE